MIKAIVCEVYNTQEHIANIGYLVQLLERGKAFDVKQKCVASDGAVCYIVETSNDEAAILLAHMNVCDMLPSEEFQGLAEAMHEFEERGYKPDKYRSLGTDPASDYTCR